MRQYKKSIAIIIALIVPMWMLLPQFLNTQSEMASGIGTPKEKVFTSKALGFSVRYPGNYKVLNNFKESGVDEYSAIFIEDTLENQAKMSGLMIGDNKSPTNMSIRVLVNTTGQDVATWVVTSPKSGYQANGKDITETKLGGLQGVSYSWSGQHKGLSLAVARGSLIYIFSVMYDTPFDRIINDFNSLLKTVGFLDAQ